MQDRRLLDSHQGWDRGTLQVAKMLGERLDAPVVVGTITRLLVDLNRREGNRALFGVVGQRLAVEERQALLTDYHRPYRAAVVEAVEGAMRHRGPVTFLSIHSFTPVMDNVPRNTDVAVLYDPARPAERRLADTILAPLADAGLRVRRNFPYRGVADGVATMVRKRYPSDRLIPVELEYCHHLFDQGWTPARLARLTAEVF